MRLKPVQIGVEWICGNELPMDHIDTLHERIRRGRELLTKIAGVDCGYDLQAWHEHFKHLRQDGYTWNGNIKLPKVMQAALGSKAWQQAVKELEADGGAVSGPPGGGTGANGDWNGMKTV